MIETHLSYLEIVILNDIHGNLVQIPGRDLFWFQIRVLMQRIGYTFWFSYNSEQQSLIRLAEISASAIDFDVRLD